MRWSEQAISSFALVLLFLNIEFALSLADNLLWLRCGNIEFALSLAANLLWLRCGNSSVPQSSHATPGKAHLPSVTGITATNAILNQTQAALDMQRGVYIRRLRIAGAATVVVEQRIYVSPFLFALLSLPFRFLFASLPLCL